MQQNILWHLDKDISIALLLYVVALLSEFIEFSMPGQDIVYQSDKICLCPHISRIDGQLPEVGGIDMHIIELPRKPVIQ
ncbi:MAG TPA: hypothetical protein VNE38_03265 [Ktedonobacteraceae bacterium]|nr:hypothetical protein [Ktedonobacteraceae bacterium]